LFFCSYQGTRRFQNKEKTTTVLRFILVEGLDIEGYVTKVVKQIVMDFGLLILHKTNAIIL